MKPKFHQNNTLLLWVLHSNLLCSIPCHFKNLFILKYRFKRSCKESTLRSPVYSVVTSYITIMQYPNQENVSNVRKLTLLQSINHFQISPIIMCTCVCACSCVHVCIVLCNFITCIKLCNHHNPDTDLPYHHKGNSFRDSPTQNPHPEPLAITILFSISKILSKISFSHSA